MTDAKNTTVVIRAGRYPVAGIPTVADYNILEESIVAEVAGCAAIVANYSATNDIQITNWSRAGRRRGYLYLDGFTTGVIYVLNTKIKRAIGNEVGPNGDKLVVRPCTRERIGPDPPIASKARTNNPYLGRKSIITGVVRGAVVVADNHPVEKEGDAARGLSCHKECRDRETKQ